MKFLFTGKVNNRFSKNGKNIVNVMWEEGMERTGIRSISYVAMLVELVEQIEAGTLVIVRGKDKFVMLP